MGKIGFVQSEGRNYFIVSLQSLLLNTLRNKFCSRYNLLKMLNTKTMLLILWLQAKNVEALQHKTKQL